ncbi:hypothetical protein [Ilumatobacter nonamiensis]|uniref:hypothetical protein n=1 Tax=Ilumatobacter nonamiensis TaxID=467093 RepID=UPI0011D2B07D|nr:hypothetical protein [Ilumatobacter nonamiensis]
MHATAVVWRGRRWILGIPGMVPVLGVVHERARVSLPVSTRVWRTWHRRNVAALTVLVFGAGLIAASTVRQAGDLFGVGLVLVLVAGTYRTRAHHNYWTTCRLSADRATVVIEPTHPEFDQQARELFTRSIRR